MKYPAEQLLEEESSYRSSALVANQVSVELPVGIRLLKTGIWLYFLLLIFEGALRKWVLPGLADPLLLVRDPIAILLIIKALEAKIWKPGMYVLLMWGVTVLALALTLLVGHGNLMVAIYGMRINLLHFPLIFLIGTIFNRQDVIKMGVLILWINILMTLLVAVQFFSPQTAFVNMGVGGQMGGSNFSGAGGFYRVPGTFSFTNGLSLFYGFAASFILFFWTAKKQESCNRILLIASTIALAAAIPLSISRTVLFEVTLSLLFLALLSGQHPKFLKSIAFLLIAGLGIFALLNNLSFFQTASDAFFTRFENASNIEGGLEGTIIDRFLGGLYSSITNPDASFYGYGLGMGTNAGAQLMMGKRAFLISEGEWGRLIGEMGFILGMLAVIIRLGLVLELLTKAWSRIREGNVLAWMLLSFGALAILQGQWAQPTALGFSVLAGGLIIASFNHEKSSL